MYQHLFHTSETRSADFLLSQGVEKERCEFLVHAINNTILHYFLKCTRKNNIQGIFDYAINEPTRKSFEQLVQIELGVRKELENLANFDSHINSQVAWHLTNFVIRDICKRFRKETTNHSPTNFKRFILHNVGLEKTA